MQVLWIDENDALDLIRRETGTSELAYLEKMLAVALDAGVARKSDGLINQFELREFLSQRPVGAKRGRKLEYDWIAGLQFLCVHIFNEGIPKRQADLERVLADWFVERYGREPAASEIRKHVAPIFKQIKADN